MSKVFIYKDEKETLASILCPACKCEHPFRIEGEGRPKWTWNGDEEKPTFSPSMLVWASRPEYRCHSFVKDGKIRFLSDCHHDMKNTTVDLPDIEHD